MPDTRINSPSLTRRDNTKTDTPSTTDSKFGDKKVASVTSGDTVATEAARVSQSISSTRTINDTSVTVAPSDTLSDKDNKPAEDDKFVDNKFINLSILGDHPLAEQPEEQSTQAGTGTDPLINQGTVKKLEKANKQDLLHYTNELASEQGVRKIGAEMSEQLQTLVMYDSQLDADMKQLNELGEKLQNRGLSKAETLKMKALMDCNKHNLSKAQGWIAATQALGMEKGTMNGATATLLSALSNRLAEHHMELANVTSRYEDSLPDKEPLTRRDRIEYNLLTARASLRAFKSMMAAQKGINKEAYKAMQKIQPALEKHCKELERINKQVKGQVKLDMSNPKLELLTHRAWTESTYTGLRGNEIRVPREELDKLTNSWDNDSPKLPLAHRWLPQPHMTQLFIEHQLEGTGINTGTIPNFGTAYKQSLQFEINQGKWPVIDKSMRGEVSMQSYNCRSRITPGGHLAKQFEKPYRGNGVSSTDRRQLDHAPNLAHTQLADEDGKVLFSGLRHGIIDAYGYNEKSVRKFSDARLIQMAEIIHDDEINASQGQKEMVAESPEDKKEAVRKIASDIKFNSSARSRYIGKIRDIASRNMARELLSAAIVTDPATRETALKRGVINVTLNSVALVTPGQHRVQPSDDTRPESVRVEVLGEEVDIPVRPEQQGGLENEQLMIKHQTQALQSLDTGDTEPVKLKIADDNGDLQEVKVNVKVRAFNFGINDAPAQEASPSRFSVLRKLMGWGFSSKANDPQLRELLGPSNKKELGGEVSRKIEILSQMTTGKHRSILLREAANQAKQIWRKRSFGSNKEPYNMVSRLALISHLMGETTLLNCKSGKGRTGQLDAEVKYLAAAGNTTGHIPDPNIPQTTESRKMRTTFMLNSGNRELNRMNSGLSEV